MHIRSVTADDLTAVFAIYNREIRESTAIFDTTEIDNKAANQWLADSQHAKHPGIVASDDDTIVGFAWLSPWSQKCGYARAAEVSVYVHRDHHRKGIGKSLLQELIQLARTQKLGVLLARIESSQAPSKKLHETLGFTHLGTQHRVGEKFNQILDVDLYEFQLDT